MATREQIEKLKENWLKDPDWDIEDREGFEEHREELLLFHQQMSEKWHAEFLKKEEERIAARALVVRVELGIVNSSVVEEVSTYREIEHAVLLQDRRIGELEKVADEVMAELMQAQVRATLLLAAQCQRIADALEAGNDNDQVDFMTRLYKVE